MPRVGAKEHWKMKKAPDEFYKNVDPWKVTDDEDEWHKAETIMRFIPNNKMGIDLGCGEGSFTELFEIHSENMFACDISRNAIERASKANLGDVTYFQWDLKNLFPWGFKFDMVLCDEVLYYIDPKDIEMVAYNITSLLKPDSDLIISVSHYFEEDDIKKLFPDVHFTLIHKEPFKDDYMLIMRGKLVPDK